MTGAASFPVIFVDLSVQFYFCLKKKKWVCIIIPVNVTNCYNVRRSLTKSLCIALFGDAVDDTMNVMSNFAQCLDFMSCTGTHLHSFY